MIIVTEFNCDQCSFHFLNTKEAFEFQANIKILQTCIVIKKSIVLCHFEGQIFPLNHFRIKIGRKVLR